jgi:hypothetical protein
MANPEHLAKLKEGVEAWNWWRLENPEIKPSLSRVNFKGTDLQGMNFVGADLSEADLSGANLISMFLDEANLSGANLNGADLCGAYLIRADLQRANLNWANLNKADLSEANLNLANLNIANLRETNLSKTNLSGAIVGYTAFVNVDLSEVIGLETVTHYGPSSIGIDTIYKSKGKIPHIFLRGAGVPEFFIENMAGLVGTGIEFYSLFISYSSKDKEFAERLHADLQDKGVRCWKDDHDMRGGRKLQEQIDEAIRLHDKLLLILSTNSMESEWVKTEISKAHKREIKEGKRILFPIRLCSFEAMRDWECFDADAGKDSAREIREYFIPDFSNWKDHDSYLLAFGRLLDDLHGKSEPPSA